MPATIRDGTRVTVRESRQTVTARAPTDRVRVVGGGGGPSLQDGDPLGYGHPSTPLVGAAVVGSSVVGDTDTDVAGRALADMARLEG